MKIPKDAARTARQLIRGTIRDGKIDAGFAKAAIEKLSTEKPRNYLATLSAYQRLLRLEMIQRHAVIESAEPLSDFESNSVLNELRSKYGQDITHEFRTNPELIGGMKVKLGSNVWDGSVRTRLAALSEAIA